MNICSSTRTIFEIKLQCQCANSVHIKFDTLAANEMNVTRNVGTPKQFAKWLSLHMQRKAYIHEHMFNTESII